MDNFFKVGVLMILAAALLLYWSDTKPTAGRYQLAASQSEILVLDTQRGTVYTLADIGQDTAHGIIDPIAGKVVSIKKIENPK